MAYFEPASAVHLNINAGQTDMAFYYFGPSGGSYHNLEKSAVNALYACGLGYVFDAFGAFLDDVGISGFTTANIVIFVGETIGSLWAGASATKATLTAMEAIGLDLGWSTLDIIVDAFGVPVLFPLIAIIGVA